MISRTPKQLHTNHQSWPGDVSNVSEIADTHPQPYVHVSPRFVWLAPGKITLFSEMRPLRVIWVIARNDPVAAATVLQFGRNFEQRHLQTIDNSVLPECSLINPDF